MCGRPYCKAVEVIERTYFAVVIPAGPAPMMAIFLIFKNIEGSIKIEFYASMNRKAFEAKPICHKR